MANQIKEALGRGIDGRPASIIGRVWTRIREANPWQVALVQALILVWIISAYAVRFDGNLSGFICIGDRFISRAELPDRVYSIPNSHGYDGQFFYFAAHDPLILGDWQKHMDVPPYRYQRILYPALVYLAAFGQARRFPEMMVGVNALALILGMWLVARFLRQNGRSPWTALLFGLLSGLLLSLFRDLSDLLATVLLVCAFIAWERERPGLMALGVCAAMLARETTLLVVPLLAADGLIRRREWRTAVLLSMALVPFVAWQYYLYHVFGEPAWHGGAPNFERPLVALAAYTQQVLATGSNTSEQAYLLVFLVSVLSLIPLACLELWKRKDALAFALLGFSVMPLVMSRYVWVEPWSYGRVLVLGPALAFIVFARGGSRLYWIPLSANAVLTVVTLAWQRLLF